MKTKNTRNKLLEYTESLQSRGRYLFYKNEVKLELGFTDIQFKNAIHILTGKNKACKLSNNLYAILPPEYKNFGSLPLEWFIDEYAKIYHANYYIGLLTAADMYGATHHKPQIQYVIVDLQLPKFVVGRLEIRFVVNKHIHLSDIQKNKTQVGYFNISTPEQTIIDLMKYYNLCGYYDNIGTIYSELIDQVNTDKLYKLIISHCSEANICRIGYLLSLVSESKTVQDLKNWIQDNIKRYYIFAPYVKEFSVEQKSADWKLYINEEVEIET
jgi:predicted transcriptional regulator of viral defense system